MHAHRPAFRHMADDIPIISYRKLQELDAVKPWPTDLKIKVAIPCVVKDRRCFSYSKGEKEACELMLDCEGGGSVQAVRWPDRKTNKIPALYKSDLQGAIGLAIFEKYTERRSFGLTDLIVFHQPATTETDDDPKDESDSAAGDPKHAATPTQGQLFPEVERGHAAGANESAA